MFLSQMLLYVIYLSGKIANGETDVFSGQVKPVQISIFSKGRRGSSRVLPLIGRLCKLSPVGKGE